MVYKWHPAGLLVKFPSALGKVYIECNAIRSFSWFDTWLGLLVFPILVFSSVSLLCLESTISLWNHPTDEAIFLPKTFFPCLHLYHMFPSLGKNQLLRELREWTLGRACLVFDALWLVYLFLI